MSALAPTLQAFFTDRLTRQRHASPNTIASYRDTLKLLVRFAADRLGTEPSQLDIAELDAELITAFLEHLQHQRGNSTRTRNARLAAIRALYRYAALRHPEHAELIQQVLAIPPKRRTSQPISYLSDAEIAALLDAPDATTWTGRRDHALLTIVIQTGLRISELIALRGRDLHLGAGAHLACHGKGRKDRTTPLTNDAIAVLRCWLAEQHTQPDDPVFPTRQGNPLSRDAIERRLAVHNVQAATSCSTLASKKVTAHMLRHTTAMRLLHAGVDTAVIALWLGHEHVETTQIYLQADLELKERAIARTSGIDTAPARFTPPDTTLAFLESL